MNESFHMRMMDGRRGRFPQAGKRAVSHKNREIDVMTTGYLPASHIFKTKNGRGLKNAGGELQSKGQIVSQPVHC
jgi:hypothetical protein